MSRLPFPQALASDDDSAARPGSCRKPPGALYVESGKECALSFPGVAGANDNRNSHRRGAGRTPPHRFSSYEPVIGFSRAIRSANRVLVSGTGPVWPDGSCRDDADAQARRCFEIIGDALAEAGADWHDVIRTRMFLTDPGAAEAVSVVHGELFATIQPAATMVIVAGLLDPRWKIEIEIEAEVAT